jgi:hypothetical protein
LSDVDLCAFAKTLKSLLGAPGEVAFRLGETECVLAQFDDNDIQIATFAVDDVDGVDHIEAWLTHSSLDEARQLAPAPASTLEASAFLHIDVTPKGIALVYSRRHLPDSLAEELLGLYAFESGRLQTVFSNAPLSVLNHPPLAPSPTLLHARFLEQAKKDPDAVAVDFLGDKDDDRLSLTYLDLDHRSLALSHLLRAATEHMATAIIPLAVPPSPELYVAYLGVLRAGYAFNPLPEADVTPVLRLEQLVRQVGARVIIGCGQRPSWMEGMKDVAWVDIHNDLSLDSVPKESWTAPQATDLAYGKKSIHPCGFSGSN